MGNTLFPFRREERKKKRKKKKLFNDSEKVLISGGNEDDIFRVKTIAEYEESTELDKRRRSFGFHKLKEGKTNLVNVKLPSLI